MMMKYAHTEDTDKYLSFIVKRAIANMTNGCEISR